LAETQTWSERSVGGGPLEFCLGLLSRFSRTGPEPPASRGALSRSEPATISRPPLASLEDASEMLGERVEGVRALAIVDVDGRIDDQVVLDPTVGCDALAEFATLVRIADRISQDAGSQGLSETTWAAASGTVLSRRVDHGRFLLLVGGPALRTSLARYVLRQAARRMKDPEPAA